MYETKKQCCCKPTLINTRNADKEPHNKQNTKRTIQKKDTSSINKHVEAQHGSNQVRYQGANKLQNNVNYKTEKSLSGVEKKAQSNNSHQKIVNRTGIPNNLKTGIEYISNLSMDDVNVNYNSNKPLELGAAAYTQGTEIFIAPGHDDFLSHEVWHVVQQKQGRVTATSKYLGGEINEDVGLEKEAEIMGQLSLDAGKSVSLDSCQCSAKYQNKSNKKNNHEFINRKILGNYQCLFGNKQSNNNEPQKKTMKQTPTKVDVDLKQFCFLKKRFIPPVQSHAPGVGGTVTYLSPRTPDAGLFSPGFANQLRREGIFAALSLFGGMGTTSNAFVETERYKLENELEELEENRERLKAMFGSDNEMVASFTEHIDITGQALQECNKFRENIGLD